MLKAIQENTNLVIVALAIILCVHAGFIWQRLGTPEQVTNNVTNKTFSSQDQNQATVIFPNKVFMFEYENFVYMIDTLEKTRLELNARCLIWNMDYVPQNGAIVHCFKKKEKQ